MKEKVVSPIPLFPAPLMATAQSWDKPLFTLSPLVFSNPVAPPHVLSPSDPECLANISCRRMHLSSLVQEQTPQGTGSLLLFLIHTLRFADLDF